MGEENSENPTGSILHLKLEMTEVFTDVLILCINHFDTRHSFQHRESMTWKPTRTTKHSPGFHCARWLKQGQPWAHLSVKELEKERARQEELMCRKQERAAVSLVDLQSTSIDLQMWNDTMA